MITNRIGQSDYGGSEYWGLACIVTDEMAEVALKMKVRKPMTFEQMLEGYRKEEKKLQDLLDEMSRVGLIGIQLGESKAGRKRYASDVRAGQRGIRNMNKQQLEEHGTGAS
ncbi:MAG: hypothetical protein ACLTLQ_06295 [[Clostridium] scindens]